jgi:hypothetical protein
MIAQLYNTQNVVVGQAACLIAPANTPVPNIALTNQSADPFDFSLWTDYTILASATITAGTFTITYTLNGVAYTTTALTATTATATQVDTALTTALAPLSPGAADVVVLGGPVSAVGTPFTIMFSETFSGGTMTLTPTGITGGTLSVLGPSWVPVGGTDQGWKFGAAKTTQDITIEEQSSPVMTTINSQKFTIEGVMSEDISRTLVVALNMTNGYTAAATGQAGYETMAMTDTPLQYAVALLMANQVNRPRWVYIPAATCLANVDVSLRRSSAKRMYSASFSSICPTTSIKIYNVLQPGQ